jgi:hypothetical protein
MVGIRAPAEKGARPQGARAGELGQSGIGEEQGGQGAGACGQGVGASGIGKTGALASGVAGWPGHELYAKSAADIYSLSLLLKALILLSSP